MEPTDRLTRLADLSAQVDLLQREIAEARGQTAPEVNPTAPGPPGAIIPPRVNPNELIESAWGNAVVDALTVHETRLPWGLQYYSTYTAVSGDLNQAPVAVPGYSVIVNTPGGRIVELQTNLSLWKYDAVNGEVLAEFRNAAGAPSPAGQAVTIALGTFTTQLQLRALFSPPAGLYQYDTFVWVGAGGGVVRVYADPGRPALTTVTDLGPYFA